jgi:hypothetical protein
MKKFLGTVLVLAVIVGLGYGGYYYWTKAKTETPAVTETATLVYDNTAYGFTLEFPATWAGYVTKDRTLSWGDLSMSVESVDFGFTAQDCFNIGMYDKAVWEKLLTEEGPKPAKIGENDKYVFGYSPAMDVVNDEMAARMGELDGIIKTFKVK